MSLASIRAMTDLGAIAYPLGCATVIIFGLAACAFAYWRQRKQGHDDSPEFFLTARNSMSTSYIAWYVLNPVCLNKFPELLV